MSGFTYTIDLKVMGRQQLGPVTSGVRKLEGNIRGVKGALGQARNEQRSFVSEGRNGFNSLSGGAGRLIRTLGGVAFGYKSIKEAADLESIDAALDFATAGEGAKNMAFLKKTTDDLKISQRASLPTFKNWMGAVRGTALEGQVSRDVFYSVAQASRVMGLRNDQTAGTFLAISQMASKGKVSSEELRQQLGERLPGALGIAARAMNMTQAELNKMMEDGKLYSDVFLPRFASQLNKEFAGGVDKALTTANAKFAEMDNSVLALQQRLGAGLIPVGTRLINNFLLPAVDFLGQHMEILPVLGSLYLGSAVSAKVFAVSQAWAATSGTLLTRSMALLNVTLWANPLGVVVGALAAVTAGMAFAWNASDTWRGRLTGLWAGIKETGKIVLDFLVLPWKTLAKLTTSALTFDLGGMKSAVLDAVDLAGNMQDAFGRVGQKYNEGFDRGVKDFNRKPINSALKKKDALSGAFGGAAAGAKEGSSGANSATDKKIKAGAAGITGGGNKVQNVTVSIGALIKELNLTSETIDQGIDQIAEIVISRLTQTLNYAQQNQ